MGLSPGSKNPVSPCSIGLLGCFLSLFFLSPSPFKKNHRLGKVVSIIDFEFRL
jgi:hypothetical protein